ncbi:MAG TPA: glycosyltransferase [Methylomirabilota bacterium]|nr:glycosyltransferase [Methylomirabilota bacterium]
MISCKRSNGGSALSLTSSDLMDRTVRVARDSTVPHFARLVIEAGALAKPVVASGLGGPAELVKDGATGLLVPPVDAGALAEAVLALIREPARTRAMGEAGYTHAGLSRHRGTAAPPRTRPDRPGEAWRDALFWPGGPRNTLEVREPGRGPARRAFEGRGLPDRGAAPLACLWRRCDRPISRGPRAPTPPGCLLPSGRGTRVRRHRSCRCSAWQRS